MVRIPDFLKHLPVFGELPIPFFTAIDAVTKRPNFRAHEPAKHAAAITKKLCGICGRPLDYWLTVIVGPTELAKRTTYMPAMHADCADCAHYALQVCPFLATQQRDSSTRAGDTPVSTAEKLPKPDRIACAKTRSYRVLRPSPVLGTEYVHFAKPARIDWLVYRDGVLQWEGEQE